MEGWPKGWNFKKSGWCYDLNSRMRWPRKPRGKRHKLINEKDLIVEWYHKNKNGNSPEEIISFLSSELNISQEVISNVISQIENPHIETKKEQIERLYYSGNIKPGIISKQLGISRQYTHRIIRNCSHSSQADEDAHRKIACMYFVDRIDPMEIYIHFLGKIKPLVIKLVIMRCRQDNRFIKWLKKKVLSDSFRSLPRRQQIIELYTKENQKPLDIAALVGCSHQYVYRIIGTIKKSVNINLEPSGSEQ